MALLPKGESNSTIERLIGKVNSDMFSPRADFSSFVPASAYETAWVAMIPDPERPDGGMFPQCLDWIQQNQNDGGYWGEPEVDRQNCIAATLACLLALHTWNTRSSSIKKGLNFLHENMKSTLLMQNGDCGDLPEWFAIVLPGMIELAQAKGLDILPRACDEALQKLFYKRDYLLKSYIREGNLNREQRIMPLEMYLEALPADYVNANHEKILRQYQSEDGSLFQSPSATACVFMATGDDRCLAYLEEMVKRSRHGVPPMYPIDEDLLKLCLVDHVRRLGCAEYFTEEISNVMEETYRNWTQMQEPQSQSGHYLHMQIFKDSLAFRLLRMHRYEISPSRFCWFVNDKKMLNYVEENYSYFLGAMYNVYRASNLMFPNESELEKAKSFSSEILQKWLSSCGLVKNDAAKHNKLQEEVEDELAVPWLARMDHLEHRKYIESGASYPIWIGKTSHSRLFIGTALLQHAKRSFTVRQAIYSAELEEIKRWCDRRGLSKMGFGRENTTLCYFGIATTSNLPLISNLRKVIAKCAILITVADDFYDEEGSLKELYSLTDAVKSWKEESISRRCRTIFSALDNLVTEITSTAHGHRAKTILQHVWHEAFESWLKEAEWSRKGHVPSIEEYLRVGMVSIAVQPIVISALLLICPPSQLDYITNSQCSMTSSLLMLCCRLLNDLQSYQKEIKDGKLNTVLLYMKGNHPHCDIEEATTHIDSLLDEKKREFVKLVKSNCYKNMVPSEFKELQLSCLKTFSMFYNSTNAFDSKTALLQSIQKAMYEPLEKKFDIPLRKQTSLRSYGVEISTKCELRDYRNSVKAEEYRARGNNGVLYPMRKSNQCPIKSTGMRSDQKSSMHISHISYLTPTLPRTSLILAIRF